MAIETSCDDTSVAIIDLESANAPLSESFSGKTSFKNSVKQFKFSLINCYSANQNLVHSPFGGIVPEIASRNHTLNLLPLVDKVLIDSKIDSKALSGVIVTSRQGLVGSLLVGVMTAKTLSQAWKIPLIGVNHLEGHILSPLICDAQYSLDSHFDFPFISLVVSGGHTALYLVKGFGDYQILGSTRDDAAGEAFDKFGQLLGLDFPGGVQVDQLASSVTSQEYSQFVKSFTKCEIKFPESLFEEHSLEFSFSGLKSSSARLISAFSQEELAVNKSNLCYGFRESIVNVLIEKTRRAMKEHKVKNVSVVGGVSANSRLRVRCKEISEQFGFNLAIPPIRFSTDNAAMIAVAGSWRIFSNQSNDLNIKPMASSLPGDFKSHV